MESVSGADVRELKLQAYDPFDERKTGDWTRALTDIERKSLAGEAPQRTARGYTGHEHVERTGLIHMNGRVYDPVIGRFLRPDPVVADASFSQSWNAYSYALNSPLSYSDPSGLTFVAGCPPGLCRGGGHGGFAPSSVFASSSHIVRSVRYTLSVSFGGLLNFGFPAVDAGNPLILNINNPNRFGGARRASSLESARHRRLAGSGPRIQFAVQSTVQTHQVGVAAAVDIGGDGQSPADTPIGFGNRLLDFLLPAANAQDIPSDVVGDTDLDRVAEQALGTISAGARVEYAGTIELSSGEYAATGVVRGIEDQVIIRPTTDTVAVYHSHVRPRGGGIGDRNLARARRWPGSGDSAAVLRGYPNYYRDPRGNIRVLELVQGQLRVRTLSGYDLLPGEQLGEGVSCPVRYCGRN